jgi:hypothetical protein
MSQFVIDRGSLLKGAGAFVVPFALRGGSPKPNRQIHQADELDGWLAIKADGDLVAYFGQMDILRVWMVHQRVPREWDAVQATERPPVTWSAATPPTPKCSRNAGMRRPAPWSMGAPTEPPYGPARRSRISRRRPRGAFFCDGSRGSCSMPL